MMSSRIVLWVNSISTELASSSMGMGVSLAPAQNLADRPAGQVPAKVQAGELWFEKALTDSFLAPAGGFDTARRATRQPAVSGTEEQEIASP